MAGGIGESSCEIIDSYDLPDASTAESRVYITRGGIHWRECLAHANRNITGVSFGIRVGNSIYSQWSAGG